MRQKAFLVLTLIFFSCSLCFALEENSKNIQKIYYEKMLIADYSGAIEAANKWCQITDNEWPAVSALANAYTADFQPRKALSVVVKYCKNTNPKDKNLIDGYLISARLDCSLGNFDRAADVLAIVKTTAPFSYLYAITTKYVCESSKFSSDNENSDEYKLFKNRVLKYLDDSQNETDNMPFNKAGLAYSVAKNPSLASKFATQGITSAADSAEKIFHNRNKIPARAKASAAIFYALNGEEQRAYDILERKPGCTATDLLTNGGDPFYLGRFFAVVGDMYSADVCFKALWQRMKTDEQKEAFFRHTVDNVEKDSPWRVLSDTDWIRQEYAKFKRNKKI